MCLQDVFSKLKLFLTMHVHKTQLKSFSICLVYIFGSFSLFRCSLCNFFCVHLFLISQRQCAIDVHLYNRLSLCVKKAVPNRNVDKVPNVIIVDLTYFAIYLLLLKLYDHYRMHVKLYMVIHT